MESPLQQSSRCLYWAEHEKGKSKFTVIFSGTIGGEPLELNEDVIKRPKTHNSSVNPWHYQLQTKAKDWKYEKEVRLIIENIRCLGVAWLRHKPAIYKGRDVVSEWKETFNYVPLTGECFDSIYFGVNIDEKKREKIVNYARTKLKPDIQLYQMQVDENAFRLKAELII